MVSTEFIYGGFTVENSDGNSEEFSVVLIKDASLGIFDITMIIIAESSKLGEEIGCMELTSLDVTNIAIKGITEATILVRRELYDEYSPLGISERISEGVKEVALLGLIEI